MSDQSFAARVESLRINGESTRKFAQSIGVSEGALRAILSGGKPTLDTLVTIAKARDVSLEWLATGEGQRERGNRKLLIEHDTLMPAGFADDVVFVTRLDVQASAGGGSIVPYAGQEDQVHDFVALPKSWLRARGINPEACRIVMATGDSMEPTIRDGDAMVIDTSIDQAKDNMIYVLVFQGAVFVKRIHQKMNGAILLISDNPVYPPEEVRLPEVADLHIAGRLVWAGRFY